MVAYGTEKPKTYRPRLVDERLQRLLSTSAYGETPGRKVLVAVSAVSTTIAQTVVVLAWLSMPKTAEYSDIGPPAQGQEGRPSIVVRDIPGRLPRFFQGRRAGDSRAIKFASYRLAVACPAPVVSRPPRLLL